MFTPVTKEPQPYSLVADRENDPPTVFWLTPQTAEETQGYLARYSREGRRGGMADPERAKRLIEHDRETLRTITDRVENAYAEGDELTDIDGIGKVIAQLDYSSLQELIAAAQNMSTLSAAAKNS